MYLTLPILIAIGLSFIKQLQLKYLWFTIPFLFLTYHSLHIEDSISENVNQKKKHVVAVAEVDNILQKCKTLKSLCDENEIKLIVSLNPFYYDLMIYGCSSCVDSFPKTLKPSYERRTWRLLEDENSVYANVLIIDNTTPFDQQFDFVEPIGNGDDKYMIKNNNLKTMRLLDSLKIHVRRYK
jgi:hypothetical protein